MFMDSDIFYKESEWHTVAYSPSKLLNHAHFASICTRLFSSSGLLRGWSENWSMAYCTSMMSRAGLVVVSMIFLEHL